jgi:hypothetical protein
MIRSHLTTAALVALAAGLSGCCSGGAHTVQTTDPNVVVVSAPQSSWCQWYYRHEAIALIKEKDPNYDEHNIVGEGPVPVYPVGKDGRPMINAKPSDITTEYQIRYVMKPKMGTGMPGSGVMPTSAFGAPNGNVVPAGGMQPPMMPTAQPTYPSSTASPYPTSPTGYPTQPTPGLNNPSMNGFPGGNH